MLFTVPEPPMLIEDFLPKAGVCGLTADPGVGKTWLTLEMCRAVASGTKFLGRFQSRMGTVVFIGQDSSVYDYARQMRKLLKYDWEEYEKLRRTIPTATNPLQLNFKAAIQPGLLLEDGRQMVALAEQINDLSGGEYEVTEWQEFDPITGRLETYRADEGFRRGADLIILDTKSAMTRVPENDNTENEIVARNLRMLADQTDAAVVLIHHNAKASENNDGESFRGASSVQGALDSWLQLRVIKDGELIEVRFKKFRGIKPETMRYRMEIDATEASLTFEEPDQASDAANALASVQPAILAYLKERATAVERKDIIGALADQFPIFSAKTLTEYTRRSLVLLSKTGAVKKAGRGCWSLA